MVVPVVRREVRGEALDVLPTGPAGFPSLFEIPEHADDFLDPGLDVLQIRRSVVVRIRTLQLVHVLILDVGFKLLSVRVRFFLDTPRVFLARFLFNREQRLLGFRFGFRFVVLVVVVVVVVEPREFVIRRVLVFLVEQIVSLFGSFIHHAFHRVFVVVVVVFVIFIIIAEIVILQGFVILVRLARERFVARQIIIVRPVIGKIFVVAFALGLRFGVALAFLLRLEPGLVVVGEPSLLFHR